MRVLYPVFASLDHAPPFVVHTRAESRRPFFESPTYRQVLERLAANVRRLRAARGWTQEECAARCGDLDLTVLRAIEAARTNVTAATVSRLCEGFGVDVAEFYDARAAFVRRGPGRPRRAAVDPADAVIVADDLAIAAQEIAPELRDDVVTLKAPAPAATKKPRKRTK